MAVAPILPLPPLLLMPLLWGVATGATSVLS
jgi:hypothetical protein